jgi:hypothetical protein
MTARVSRLSGALVVETEIAGERAWFLVGDTKVPCDFFAAGFERPPERDARRVPCVRLVPLGSPRVEGASLTLPLAGEDAARLVAERLLVPRNGSVSERLWRLIFGADDAPARVDDEPSGELDARWLGEMPPRIWDVVRDAVLKCT